MRRAGLGVFSVIWGLAVIFIASPALAGLEDFFVSTDWLDEHRQEVTVVDVRVTPLYFLGHIDEALSIPKEEFLSTRGGIKSLVPTVSEFEALMDRYGITPQTTVVAYAEDDNPYGARFIWTLRYHGHERAYVLDGGYDKWAKEDRATAYLPTRVTPSMGYRCHQGSEIRADADDILTHLGNPSVAIWDTRSPGEFDGSDVRADRGGHIPGAIHLNWTHLQREVNGVKVLKSEEEIRDLLTSAGLTQNREIVAHCQTGIRSSYATLVLLSLGYRIENYDGSWIEWANNRALPVEKTVRTASRSH